MKKLVVFLCFIPVLVGLGQSPIANFSTTSIACLNENIQVVNLSSNANRFEWDVCQGDLSLAPVGSNIGTVVGSNIPLGIDVIFDGTSWFGFVTSRNSNSVIRYTFDPLLSSIESVNDLGNFGGLLNQPVEIKIVSDNGNWYGFISNQSGSVSTSLITRVDFGVSLSNNSPLATSVISDITFASDGGLDIVRSGSVWYLLYNQVGLGPAYRTGVVKLNTIQSIPAPSEILFVTYPGMPALHDIKILMQGGTYHAYSISDSPSKLFHINFGTDLYTTPSPTDISSILPAGISPYGIDGNYDNGNYYILIATDGGSIVKNNLGSDLSNSPLIIGENLGNLGVFSSTRKIRLIKDKTNWYAFSVNYFTGSIYKAAFPTPACSHSPGFLTNENIQLNFNSAGSKAISLRSYRDGEYDEKHHLISVSPLTSPSIEISYDGICLGSFTNFSFQSNQTIVSQTWDFGDTHTSGAVNPQHTYSSTGPFTVQLEVQSSNGCNNTSRKSIQLYNQPTASFTPPSGLLCTNNEFTFVNTTPDNFDGNLVYQWRVDGQSVSSSRDLNFTFTNTGPKEISMQASIPGCSDTEVQTTSSVETGPVVDFDVTGKCLQEATQLTNNSSGSIASMLWDLGNGQFSNQTSPSLTYSSIGLYPIQLSVTGTNGCISNKTVNHRIYSLPQPNFNIDLPPFSCSGSPTQFNDLTPALTDSNLQSWLWDFNDGGSTSSNRNPQHTYANSGDYVASLTVTSDQGCVNTLAKTITISPSPQPIINNTPACEDADVELSDGAGTQATSWRWDVEDALYFTPTANHVFSSPGSYLVDLLITGSNGCESSVQKTIIVPQKPSSIDFTSQKKCVGSNATFNAQVLSVFDPIAKYEWQFGSAIKEGSEVTNSFTSTGFQEVQMRAIGQSGCVYSLNKSINVLPTPVADFTFTPESGPPPLAIQFTNLSSNASQFKWFFNDALSSQSISSSPLFTYTALGDYPVDLVASNAEGCEAVASKLVSVALPRLIIAITNLQVQETGNGTVKVMVALENRGNVFVDTVPLQMELSNGAILQELAAIMLRGGQSTTHEFATLLLESSNLKYLCVEALVEGNTAQAIETKVCTAFEPFTVINAPYPNPTSEQLTIEWISVTDEDLQFQVTDQLGQQVLTESIRASEGFNKRQLNVRALQSGLYFITLRTPASRRTFRTIIAR
jgi:PKD repeat protein